MVIYHNIEEIKCKLIDDKWSCDITRLFSEKPQKIDDKLCYQLKTETVHNLDDVHLTDGKPMKCILHEDIDSLRCEGFE